MVRRVALLLAAALVVLAPSAANAAVRIRHVDASAYPDVRVVVSTDTPQTLSRDDVLVRENGLGVSVTAVKPLTPSAQRVDVILAIDVSNSMRGTDLGTALAAAEEFVQRVPDGLRVGIVSFAGSTSVVSPLTSDRAALVAAVGGIGDTTTPGTALYDAVRSASELFGDQGQHNLIVLTDGRNTATDTSLPGAVSAANGAGVTVYTIGLAGSGTDDTSLRQLAGQTHGTYRSLSPKDLDAAYASLAAQLSHQYVVTYRSKVPAGFPATVVVSLPDGADRARVLIPAVPSDGEVAPARSNGLFSGDLGLGMAVAATFLAVLFLVRVASTIGRDERRRRSLAERVLAVRQATPAADEARGGIVPRPIADVVERGARAARASDGLSAKLARAGWSVSVGEFLAPALLVPPVLGFVVGTTLDALAGVALTAIVVAIPFVVLSVAARRRARRAQEQLPDVLMILASSLRAGHSFLQALDAVAREIGEPAGSEFARTLSEIRLGRNADEALEALASRVGGQDLEWAVTAINIQRKVGGNLAEVLETVAATIRERQMIRRQVKVLSAEGRLSVTILVVLPFVIGLYLAFVNPDYLSALTGTVSGLVMLAGAGFLMLVGFVWMKKVIRLDV